MPIRLVLGFLAFLLPPVAAAAPIVFSVGGDATTASIQPTVDTFRAALGNPNNGNAPGPLAGGRREINWDGGGSDANAPGGTPFDVFLNTRGGQFTTPGTGFVQAPPSGGPSSGLEGFFGNATYGDDFGTFSSPRLFVPTGSNITEGVFSLPGSNGALPAAVSGFGAVFTDVDLAGTTIEYFDAGGNLVYTGSVPLGKVADKSLSFLGVVFNAGELIARVRITSGNAPLGSAVIDGGAVDLVAMDDFLYSEPRTTIPEPSTLALLGLCALGLFRVRRRYAKGPGASLVAL